jgi:nucleoid-associated protein YgaU
MKFAPPTTGAPGAGELADTETTAGTRSTFSDSESGDPFDDSPTEQPLKGTKETPRLAHHTPDAIPIQAVGEPATKKGRKPVPSAPSDEGDDEDPSLDLPLDLDEPGSAATDAETDNDSEPLLLRAPAAQRDAKVPPSGSGNRKTEPGHAVSGSEDNALGGFTVAEERSAAPKGQGKRSAGISTVDAQLVETASEESDPLDGFEPEDTSRRRATSRTVVMRSQTSPPAAAVDNDGWIADDSPPSANKASGNSVQNPGSPTQKIVPRHPAAGAHASPVRSTSELRPARDSLPHNDSYTVAPNDNFWVISRKRYGTARYFAALAKHNQERIPDPQRLRAGMQVSTPPVSVLEERYPDMIDKSGSGSSTTTPATHEPASGRPTFEKPATARSAATGESAATTAPTGYFYSKSGAPMYRIGADDTLSSIAQRHLGKASRWTEIYEQNQEVLKNPENLTLGTVIRLPPDAAQIGLAPEVDRRR